MSTMSTMLSFNENGGEKKQTSIHDDGISIELNCKGCRYLYFNDVSITPLDGTCTVKVVQDETKHNNTDYNEKITETTSIYQRPSKGVYPHFDLYFNGHMIERKQCTFNRIIKVEGRCQIDQTVYHIVDS